MIIQILIDNPNSWMIPYAIRLKNILINMDHQVSLVNRHTDVKKGDILLLLSCEKIFKYLSLNKYNLVVHSSNLPKGKGWSPLTWLILEGQNTIPITLFEATDTVDSGNIYEQSFIEYDGTEINPELKYKQGIAIIDIILSFIKKYPVINVTLQKGDDTFYRKRVPEDSELDTNKTIEEQFNLLRVVDNERYPAFFIRKGVKYIIKIYKQENENSDI